MGMAERDGTGFAKTFPSVPVPPPAPGPRQHHQYHQYHQSENQSRSRPGHKTGVAPAPATTSDAPGS
jgi:hypothetical protein